MFVSLWTEKNCQNPSKGVNAADTVKPDTFFEGVVEYACEYTYKYKQGDLARHCVEAGTWNGTALECEGKSLTYECKHGA